MTAASVRGDASRCCERAVPRTQLNRQAVSMLDAATAAVEAPTPAPWSAPDGAGRHAHAETSNASPRGPPLRHG